MLLDNWNIVSASTVLSAEPQDPRIYVASVLSPARGCVIWETSALTLSTNKKPRNEAAALLLLSKYLLLVSTAVLLFLKSHNLELDLPPLLHRSGVLRLDWRNCMYECGSNGVLCGVYPASGERLLPILPCHTGVTSACPSHTNVVLGRK